jgi:hypothetical protein
MAGISNCQLNQAVRLDLPEPVEAIDADQYRTPFGWKARGVADASPHVEILREGHQEGGQVLLSTTIHLSSLSTKTACLAIQELLLLTPTLRYRPLRHRGRSLQAAC